MRILFSAFILLAFLSDMNAQIGVRFKYNFNRAHDLSKDLEDFFGNEMILDKGYGVGINYWFRLKNTRVEFLPELYGEISRTGIRDDAFDHIRMVRAGVNFNTHFYVLDFEGDCNCPTFSKEGPSIEKGFFFHLSPGLAYNIFHIESSEGSTSKFNYPDIKIGGGVGLDVGVNDLLTITPIYSLNYFTGSSWTVNTQPILTDPLITTDTEAIQHSFMIKVGLRFDY